MKKEILVLSMVAGLTGCDLDNSEAKKVPADFNNEYETQVGFDGTRGEGMDVEVTFGHGSASGVIGVTDVNYGEADPNYDLIPEATYGTFVMTAEDDGAWTYDLDETHPEVMALQGNPTASLTDSITITSLDGTTTQLNIIIKGTDPQSAAEFRGAFVANVSIRETTGFGRAQVYDPNFNESSFLPQIGIFNEDTQEVEIKTADETTGKIATQFGVFTINAEGQWEYSADKNNPGLADIIEPEDATFEEFIVYSQDGTESTFRVNITGAPINFAARIPSETDLTSVYAIDFLHGGITASDVADGKIAFSAKMTGDMATSGKLGFTCASWNGNNDGGGDNRRMAQFWMQPDGMIEMWSAEIKPGGSFSNGAADYAKNENNQYITDKVVFDQMYIPDEWVNFVMSWEYSDSASLTYLTLSIDDIPVSSPHGAIPTDPTKKIVAQTVAGSRLYKCLDEARFFVQKNEENGGSGALLIDDIKFYTNIDADLRFDTPDFEESFVSYNENDDIKSTGEPRYQNITTDNITVVRDR